MPVQAYVLIRTRPGYAKRVAQELTKVQGCRAVCSVTGRYDVIAFVEAADLQALGSLIVERVHAVEGVERTETAVVV
ncbi:MAG: Lrp/AsnC ligand binding domain-containing protein [Candidatus Caldarchaeales archaeon]